MTVADCTLYGEPQDVAGAGRAAARPGAGPPACEASDIGAPRRPRRADPKNLPRATEDRRAVPRPGGYREPNPKKMLAMTT